MSRAASLVRCSDAHDEAQALNDYNADISEGVEQMIRQGLLALTIVACAAVAVLLGALQ